MFNKKIISFFIISITFLFPFKIFAEENNLFDNNENKPNENISISTNAINLVDSNPKKFVFTIGSNVISSSEGEFTLQTPVVIIDGRLYLPLRFISENILSSNLNFDSQTQEITIKKNFTEIKLYVGQKIAIINGQKIAIENEPLSKNSTTLLPIKFFSQYFDLKINFDTNTKQIIIEENEKDINPPIANFNISKNEFTQGEPIIFEDTSSDIDGDFIIKSEFKIKELNLSDEKFENIIKKIPNGKFTILYRVLNNKNMWSEYIEKNITILENKAPEIINLKPTKSSIGRGEEFNIIYDYKNEDWEKISDEIWTYRFHNQDESKAKKGKPNRLFSEGNYIITLQLKDSFGNISQEKSLNLKISSKIVQTQLQYLAEKDITNTELENYNNKNYLEVFKPIENINFIDNNDILIMSDSPENVFEYGILYEEELNETSGRILTYHVNKLSEQKMRGAGIAIVVENLDEKNITFSLEKTGMKGPSDDPHEVGGKVLEAHFTGLSLWEDTIVQKKTSKIIYDSRKELNWKPNNLISMLSEFKTNGKIKIKIVAIGPNTKLEHIQNLPYLQRDQHPRGTFFVTERLVNIDTPRWDAMSVILGKDNSEWIVGKDKITNKETINKGNYGIEYRITINPKEDTLVILNCRGGAFRGFIGWNDGVKKSVSSFGPNDARYVGKLEANKPSTIRYMLPNGSASPVQIGFLPKSTWHR